MGLSISGLRNIKSRFEKLKRDAEAFEKARKKPVRDIIDKIKDPSGTEPDITFNPGFNFPGIPSERQPVQGRDLLPDPSVGINDPRGGIRLGESEAGQDEGKILAEAELAKKLQEEQFGAKRRERASSLQDLSQLLTQRNERTFAENSPDILEDLNARGLLRSSALGDRFAKERGRLESRSQEQIGLQSLQDRETSLNESTGILDQFLGSRQSAVQRRFSLEDFARQTEASLALGSALPGVQQPSVSGKGGAQTLGAIAGPAATVGAAAIKPTYICTKLKQLGLMTVQEVNQVHNKIFNGFTHFIDFAAYAFFAPRFIKRMEKQQFDWQRLKRQICDDILQAKSSQDAFNRYKNVCIRLFVKEFPLFAFFYGHQKELNYGISTKTGFQL